MKSLKPNEKRAPVSAPYDPAKIEKKWQKKWQSSKIYRAQEKGKEKFYVLDMFPYPSGEGLHVGHPKGYIATDVISRMKRMQGKNVLHPMGFDAFGLPAENYALKTKTHPEIAVKKNVARYKQQLEILGFDYDWSREVNTTDPAYYKWTQWIFLQMWKKGLAFESNEPINWCPSCKTGLANEDIEDGRCERCGTPVEKKPLRQWVLRITDYADRLLKDLDAVTGIPTIERKTGVDAFRPDEPISERWPAVCIIKHWSEDKYLCADWKATKWKGFVIGGIEDGETVAEAALREVREETGYMNAKFVREIGKVDAKFYQVVKRQNRVAHFTGVLVQLENDARQEVAQHEKELQDLVWLSREEVGAFLTHLDMVYLWDLYTGAQKQEIKPLLDWPESIKELQRNWIGRSEGAEISFKVKGESSKEKEFEKVLTVFTTRPDTLFGVTYVVVAPEHPWVAEVLPRIENRAEVEAYIAQAARESEIERTDASKEKTGVELKGVKAINPANGEEVPVWIADYVLADYGTGAVMAVPAHDERDFAFAKKFKLPIRQVIAPEFGVRRQDEQRRDGGCALVFDPKTQKYGVYEAPNGHVGFFGGGVEADEDMQAGIIREVEEESGLHDFEKVVTIETADAHYYHSTKKLNRVAGATCLLAILKSSSTREVKREDHEDFELVWMTAAEIDQRLHERNENRDVDHWIRFLRQSVGTALELGYDTTSDPKIFRATAYAGAGRLIDSGPFTGKPSDSAKRAITESVGGRWITKYKLRDWVFSRQRYWGEPIPLIHCEKCGVVGVPEKELPVKLPKVTSYEPTGTGESPLAAIEKWVNVKCPQCKGKAKRETNTMPQWAGSCWYYLRYEDPNNKKALVDPKKEAYWSPVDLYVGGAEHATRHLIYARFWHKFLYDIGTVSTSEPFAKLQSVGLIMGEDGRKMSKRFGNVVNPDEIVATYGADTLRVYEMFMGPFDQQIAWSTSSMVGARRFIERVWKMREKVGALHKEKKAEAPSRVINRVIKKVSEDIAAMRFNTAISALMIAVNDLERAESVSRADYRALVQLLAPFAPHVAEELWASMGEKGSIHVSVWPEYDPALIADTETSIVVQVNGKTRASFAAAPDAPTDELERRARELPEIQKWLSGATVKRVIVVPGRLVNIVVENSPGPSS